MTIKDFFLKAYITTTRLNLFENIILNTRIATDHNFRSSVNNRDKSIGRERSGTHTRDSRVSGMHLALGLMAEGQ